MLDIAGITPYKEDAFVIMGMNKSIVRAHLKKQEDNARSFANFTKGWMDVEAVEGWGRARLDTERAKFSYVQSSAADGTYVYTATVPDNKNKTKFIISKIMMSDWMLSAEYTPKANLKEGRTLGELYVTGMAYENGKLYAVSKNFNTLLVIDEPTQTVEAAYSLPAELTDVRGLIKTADSFEVVDHNKLITLKLAS